MPEPTDPVQNRRVRRQPQGVLLLGFGPGYDLLGPRLEGLGYPVFRAETLEDALGSLQLADPPVRALLLPPEPPLGDLPNSLRWLDERSAEGLRAVVIGARASHEQSTRLRDAGVTLALWEPFTDGELRFVVNHLVYNPRRGEARAQLRVPTRLLAQLRGQSGAQQTSVVHNLSVDGAYLETSRPAAEGSELEIELPLPGGLVRLRACVLSSFAPSPWRHGLPKGMGVRFLDAGVREREALERYVDELARAFQL